MDLFVLFTYLFGSVLLFCGLMVLFSSNPVHSILYLVLLFCNGAGLLMLLQVEFLSLIYIVVYIGAVAVLFLFVVMMLNINSTYTSKNFLYIPVGLLFSGFLFIEIYYMWDSFFSTVGIVKSIENWSLLANQLSNLDVIGDLLFTYNFLLFVLCGFVLFLAMIGAIVLTVQHRVHTKRQNIFKQHARSINILV